MLPSDFMPIFTLNACIREMVMSPQRADAFVRPFLQNHCSVVDT